jgi:hypothetical protein
MATGTTIPNITVLPGETIDIYADAGVVAAGVVIANKINISMIGNGLGRLYFGESAPVDVNNESGYINLRPKTDRESRSDYKGAFIYSLHGCTVNISLATKSIIENGGVPEDVTRQLRIEGHNQAISGGNVWHDIWEGGANEIPEPSQSGQQVQVVSSNSGDTLLGAGGQVVRIDYLNTDNELTSEEIDLDGTTPVLSVATNITDIIDFFNVSVGSSTVSIGDIDITDVGNIALIYNRTAAGGNKSMSTLRHLLPTSVFYLTQLVVSGDTKGTDVMLRSNSSDSGEVFGDDNWLFQVPITMSDAPTTINFNPAIVIPPTARVKVSARGSNAGNSISVFMNGWVKV